MSGPFTLSFDNGRTAAAIRAERMADLPAALASLGLRASGPVLVLVGGAGNLTGADLDRLYPVFVRGVAPAADGCGAVVIDGGTDAGVMWLLGKAREELGASFPLVGVAAIGTVTVPGSDPPRDDAAPLDARHTHFLLVPGDDWGDESPWLARAATALAGGKPSVTVLVNGGEIAFTDVRHSLKEGRPVLAVEGTGRTAEALVAAVRGEGGDQRAARMVASGLIATAGSPDDPEALAVALTALLDGTGP